MDTTARNEVLLVGRLAGAPAERELPSGDALVTFRVVVDRPPARRPVAGTKVVTVDALECVVRTAGLRKTAASWQAGDVLEVTGSLHRRFWRAPSGGPASRYEVEVLKARRLAKAA